MKKLAIIASALLITSLAHASPVCTPAKVKQGYWPITDHNGEVYCGCKGVSWDSDNNLVLTQENGHDSTCMKGLRDADAKVQKMKENASHTWPKIGMTTSEVVIGTVLGLPESRNTISGKYGVHEQWVYKHGVYLYFENDILTDIQTQN